MSEKRWQQVSRIYHDAAVLSPQQRVTFLRHACGSDAVLRAEVESLFVDNSNAERLLEQKRIRLDLIGQRIGVYEIRSLLGAGGMGEVFRACDTKLGRDVAIKVLPAEFTSDPDRLARFEREARLLATLNHPHIGAIHGFEDASGIQALVLELVEGETLADRLSRGPIAIREELLIAGQIAEALEAAHDRGIVHRDLKPANIKITPDGNVKVLDFGLAKLHAGADGSLDRSNLSTMMPTAPGLIVGTAAYMSPEQAKGGEASRTSDVWAFGCVLYEMLAGRRAFEGGTMSEILANVLKTEPDWQRLPAETPQHIRRLLRRSL